VEIVLVRAETARRVSYNVWLVSGYDSMLMQNRPTLSNARAYADALNRCRV
jgi:hypothetical protein